jgi:hypothetical protein
MDNHDRGVVTAMDYTTGLATITVGGTTGIIAQVIGEFPVVNAEVYVSKRGDGKSDWVVTDVHAPSGRAGTPTSRYTFARTALGLGASAFADIGTPPSTGWSTGATGSNTSTITITKQCHLDLWVQWNNQWSLLLNATIGGNSWSAVHLSETQSGGAYRGGMSFSMLLDVGDTIGLGARNVLASTNDLIFKTFMTLTDVVVGTLQT